MKLHLKQILKLFAYVSGDEVERADAREMPYENVVSHPREISIPMAGEAIVIGIDGILFNDRAAGLKLAREAADSGATIGIHTYYRDEPHLSEIAQQVNVIVGKTHDEVLTALEILQTPDEIPQAA